MIGLRFEDGDGLFEVVGQRGGVYALRRVDVHGPVIEISAAEIAARFNVTADEPAQPDEQAGWDALAESNREGALRAARGDFAPEPTPEDIFREAADDA